MSIPFNKPYLAGKEFDYIIDAAKNEGKLSGNGKYTKLCQEYFQRHYSFRKCLLTTSCTDALEMSCILAGIQPGDEVILPSYTFVSTANAFLLRGAKLIFVDSRTDHPGIDESKIEASITPKTKAIVVVHYAGVAVNMKQVMDLADKHNLVVIEDAAQGVDSYYLDASGRKLALGSIGHMSAFSFHETKNVQSGEGGMLVVNDDQYSERSEIVWEKGTNRSAFFRGEVDKYGWVDIGSSFLPSEVTAAFLYAQLERLEIIQKRRLEIWHLYHKYLSESTNGLFSMPHIPDYATNNAHMFYVVFQRPEDRSRMIQNLRSSGIHSVFHYLSLHKSEFFRANNTERITLPETDRYSECLMRLPMFFELSNKDVEDICSIVTKSFGV